MNDLNTLLDRAAGPASSPVDARPDLTRGHRALARTRRRRGAAGLLGVATAGVVGLGATRLAGPNDATRPARAVDRTTSGPSSDAASLRFLAQPLEAGPYTFPTTPEGWEVQGVRPAAVTIAPVGFPDQNVDSFEGKLVILFDGNPPSGEQVDVDGRTVWVRDSGGGYTTMATRTRPGEPDGTVSIQYPTDTGWTQDQMLAFLAGVTVGAGAQQGVG